MHQGAVLVRPMTGIIDLDAWGKTKRTIWSTVYSPFDLVTELVDFVSLRPWFEGDDSSGRWCAPFIKGLDLDRLIEALRGIDIRVRFFGSMKRAVEVRNHKNDSYWAGISRTNKVNADLQGLSVKSLDERGVKLCSVREYLLFNYASCLIGGFPLDHEGTSTVCGGSRIGECVARAHYSPAERVIDIKPMSITSVCDPFIVRELSVPE